MGFNGLFPTIVFTKHQYSVLTYVICVLDCTYITLFSPSHWLIWDGCYLLDFLFWFQLFYIDIVGLIKPIPLNISECLMQGSLYLTALSNILHPDDIWSLITLTAKRTRAGKLHTQ